MELVEFFDERGRSPFEAWFNRLNAQAAAKITTALVRLENGHTSNIKSAGGGLYELKIGFGPGYRIYFGYDGPQLIILLAGGTKKRQHKDIDAAKKMWMKYKANKKKES